MTPETKTHLIQVSDMNLQMHRDTKNTSFNQIDKIIFTVITGALAVSITFIGFLQTRIEYPSLLIFSWIFLSAAMAYHYRAHRIQIQESRQQTVLINIWRRDGFPDYMNFETETVAKDPELKRISELGKGTNDGIRLFLSAGALCLILFALINVMAQQAIKEREYERTLINERVDDQMRLLQLQALQKS